MTSITSPYLRIAAIEATAKAGTDDERTGLLALVGTEASKDRDVAAKLISLLHPQHTSNETLLELVATASHPKANRADRLEALLSRHLLDGTSADVQRSLLAGLAGQFRIFESSDGEKHIPRDQYWLVAPLASLLAAHITDETLAAHSRETAIAVLETCGNDHDFYSGRSLEILEKDCHLRSFMFWRRVQEQAREQGKVPREIWELKLPRPLHLGADDIPWLELACVERPKLEERFLALHAIVDSTARKDEAFWAAMNALAETTDDRHGGRAMQTRLARRRAWSPEPRYARFHVRHRAFDLRDRKLHAAWHKRLRAQVDFIQSGADEEALEQFYHACPGNSSNERSERASIEKIAEMYDADVAEAARQGFIAFWRRHEPIRVEDHPPNSIPWRSSWGLVGLALDVDGGTDITQLSDDLFRRAVAYAPWEMSAFPSWLESCATSRPTVVAEVFAPALLKDFNAPSEPNELLGHLLYKLPRESLAVRTACAPQLAELLLANDPPRCSVLEYALKALDGTSALTADLLRLSRDRAAASEDDAPRFSIWWRESVVQAPIEAIDYLADVLKRRKDPGSLLETLLDDLGDRFDRRSGRGLEHLRRSARALARLNELVDIYVPRPIQVDAPEESAHWSGREFRSHLSNWLAAIDAPEATAELRRLSERDGLPVIERDWLRHLAEARAVADVSKPMSSAELVKFLAAAIVEPKTERELFELTMNRLRDVQYSLAHDDFSLRSAFNPQKGEVLEEPVQNFLAKELDTSRRGQYEVVREPEVARKKKPDIRLVNPRCAGPTTIEIKIAERWTVEMLEEALSSQLVEQYMKANRSNFGIYVICSSGPKGSWPTPEGTTIDFSGLISRLSELARQLLVETSWIQGLEVVPIDFH